MKISMNGFRRRLSGEIGELRDVIERVVNDGCYDDQELVDALNDVICSSNALNCCYYKNDPDFTEMAEVEVPTLKIL